MESRTGIRDHPLIQPLDQAVLAIFWDPIFMDVQLFVPTSEKISHSHLMLLVSHGIMAGFKLWILWLIVPPLQDFPGVLMAAANRTACSAQPWKEPGIIPWIGRG